MHQISFALPKRHANPSPTDPRWAALNAVQAAMEALGLRDRDIAVLRGLLTFVLPDKWGDKLMVYASNATLQARCDGIDERTLRRRLARLCEVGLITRQQSPNRKRYVVRDDRGEAVLTYGFNLAPLRDNLAHIEDLAAQLSRTKLRIKMLKAILRDRLYQFDLAGFPPETETSSVSALHLLLRRKVDIPTLETAIQYVEAHLPAPQIPVELAVQSNIMTGSDSQNVRDIQSSEKEYIEDTYAPNLSQKTPTAEEISLTECIEAAPAAVEFSLESPKSWQDVERLAHQLAPAIGVQPSQLQRTRSVLGERATILAILGLVQAYGRIRVPSRYLSALTTKARDLGFDAARMFRSLTANRRFPAGNHA
jgi:replication initiation protein RepC